MARVTTWAHCAANTHDDDDDDEDVKIDWVFLN